MYSEKDIAKYGNVAPNAVPGISWTSNPDDPKPYERPPKFVTYKDASTYVVQKIMRPANMEMILSMLRSGVPLENLTEIIVKRGVFDGLYNVDVMLLIIEPVMLTLMALAKATGVDYIMSDDDEELDQMEMLKLSQIGKGRGRGIVAAEQLSKDIPKKTIETKLKSLLGSGVVKQLKQIERNQ